MPRTRDKRSGAAGVSDPEAVAGRAVLYACFFLSGCAALIYEVVWARYLALFLGGSGSAHVVVLSSFMAGLAIGAWLWGRVADRVAQPLKLFVFLELGIGLYAAAAFEPVLSLSKAIFLALARGSEIGAERPAMAAAKLAAAALALLPPTILMGGTLPVLGRHLSRTAAQIGPRISFLYFLNSIGAVAGCLLAGFYLLREMGLHASLLAGSLMNAVSGVAAMAIAGRAGRGDSTAGESPGIQAAQDSGAPRLPPAFLILLLASGASGAVSMVYEVAWIRLLALALGSSTYSFSLMLATFILGLSLGGLLLSLRKKEEGYAILFGLAELAVGLSVLASLPLYSHLPFIFNQIASSLSREPATFVAYQFCQLALCALVMILPTIFQGITFPAAIKALAPTAGGLGRRVGLILAVNTIGSVIGTLFAGFFSLPALGIRTTLELAVAINAALAVAILLAAPRGRARRRALGWGFAWLALAVAWRAWASEPWNLEALTSGVYRTRSRISSYADLERQAAKRKTIFYRDGLDATVVVQDVKIDLGQRVLSINGKVDATNSGDIITQKMLGHLPMLIHPNPRRALVVGLGSGATVGAIAAHDIERADFVEILPEVFEASRLFDSVNGRYWENPRVHGHCEDAKTFLAVTQDSFDTIACEPTNPWIAGVANVFSQDFYTECRDRLAPGGLFVQWIQFYEMEDTVLLSMLETLTSVFPCYTLWNTSWSDLVFVGSVESYAPDFERMETRLARPAVAEDMEKLAIRGLFPILGMQMEDRAAAPSHIEWTEMRLVHTDLFPYLDFAAPRGFFIGATAKQVGQLDDRFKSPANARLWLGKELARRPPSQKALSEAYAFARGNKEITPEAARRWAGLWFERFPDDPLARAAWAESLPPSNEKAAGLLGESAAAGGPQAPGWSFERLKRKVEDYASLRSAFTAGGAAEILAEVETALGRMNTESAGFLPALLQWKGMLLHDLGRAPEAQQALEGALLEWEKQPAADANAMTDAALLLCESRLSANDAAGAQQAWTRWLESNPGRLEVRMMGARISAKAGTQEKQRGGDGA